MGLCKDEKEREKPKDRKLPERRSSWARVHSQVDAR